MAKLVIRLVVVDVKDKGNTTAVSLRPCLASDSPNGTENNSVFPTPINVTPFDGANTISLEFKASAGNPFVKTGQVVATFAAG